ncbi:MAG: hypothetical protein MRK01_08005 [Candidatus Scalindua sp.]|nr:hypothetical protein [Candidatus Scalindua sp.]
METMSGRLFFAAVSFLAIFEFCCFQKVVFSEEGSFTAASGFNRSFASDDDMESKSGENIDGNALFGGNVGIGTREPQARLHIGGKPGVDGIMFPDGTMQTTATTSSGEGKWGTNNTSIYNLNEGNIGVGTMSPDSKLEVNGNIKAKMVNGNDAARTQTFQVFPLPGDYIFATSSTTYSPVSKMIPGGLAPHFLSPITGTKRFYRLKVSYIDDILSTDEVAGSHLRYYADKANIEIFNFCLEFSSSSGAWIKQRTSERFQYADSARSLIEARSGVEGRFLQIYGIWIIAEDVVK